MSLFACMKEFVIRQVCLSNKVVIRRVQFDGFGFDKFSYSLTYLPQCIPGKCVWKFVVMGLGQKFLTQVGSGWVNFLWLGLGQPFMVWVMNLENFP